jgi:hypothetical protein
VTVVLVAILLALNVYIGVAHYTNYPAKNSVTNLAALALTGGYQLFFPAA